MKTYQWNEPLIRRELYYDLMSAPVVKTDTWQAMDVSKSPAHLMHELEDTTLLFRTTQFSRRALQLALEPDLPWAEDHFRERISGVPYNPAPSARFWPHAVRNNSDHTTETGTYDHTYPERFWPKHAGHGEHRDKPNYGIRFAYGDFDNVIDLLGSDPTTRQAYLPIWFPEDTGARGDDGQPIRVPCTLGYHFMIRRNELSCRYYMRSCDAYRHLTNDVYMAVRLMQEVVRLVGLQSKNQSLLQPGDLVMHVASMHLFVADEHKVQPWM